jgi:uncharacterized protein (DUF1015 family)
MTEINTFKAIVFNPDKVKDLSKVFCPPYDVISKKEQNMYYKKNPNNFIRVILGKDLPGDNLRENRYTRARKTFEKWLKTGILREDKERSFYFYSQEYVYKGERRSRLGFIGLLRLKQSSKKSKIFPHESTQWEAKEDRFQLIKRLKANLSPIFVLFSDKDKMISRIFDRYLLGEEPFIDISDMEGIKTRLWRLSDDTVVKRLKEYMKDKSIYIADGHHRYEVAQFFCNIMKKKKRNKFTGKEDFNYIMAYFTDLNSKDLQILPIHRLIKRLPLDINVLQGDFSIEKVKDKYELFILLRKAGIAEHAYGIYKDSKYFLLRFNYPSRLDQYISIGSREFKNLDVSILQYIIFKKLKVKDKDVVYIKDEEQAINMVDEQKAEAVFFLNPVKIEQLRIIASGGEKMPPKSTYFYPKVLSGLVINQFNSLK